MAIDEQTKSTIINGFSNVVRHCQIPGLDVQRLSMAFRMTLDSLEPGGQIELQPLLDYLVTEQKLPEKNVVELCVVLKARESKLGVTFLPAAKQIGPYMSTEEADKIVGAFNQKVDKAVGTWEKTGEVNVVGKDPKSTPGMQMKQPAGPANEPSKKNRSPSKKVATQRLYAGILGVLVLACIAFYAWREETREPEVKDITTTTQLPSGGLPCAPLTSNGPVAFCDIPSSLANGTAPETLAAQAGITKSALIGAGVRTLYVRSKEESRIVLIK